MVNKQKLIIMTKMAVYDKRYGDADRTAHEYFRHDYIYRKNIWTRICAGLGGLILLGMYWIYQLFVARVDIFAADMQKYLTDGVIFILAIIALYTLLGTVLGTLRYHQSQQRLNRYMSLLKQLDRINEQEKQRAEAAIEEASDLYYGATISHKRNPY